MNDPVTVNLPKQSMSPFIKWEIIKCKNHPLFGKSWHLVHGVKEDGNHSYTLSMRKLNISRWRLIRNIELRIIKKLLTQKTQPK